MRQLSRSIRLSDANLDGYRSSAMFGTAVPHSALRGGQCLDLPLIIFDGRTACTGLRRVAGIFPVKLPAERGPFH